MKSKHLNIVILVLSVVFFSGCNKENNACLKGTGKIVKETRSIPEYIRNVQLEKNINLFIKQDSYNSLVIEAGENLQNFITTEIKGDLLVLTNKNKCNFLRSYEKEINAYLTLKNLDSVECNGSGNLTIRDTFYTDNISFNFSRTTGDMDVTIYCVGTSEFKLHQGVSNVTARGYSHYNIAYNSGHGWYYMRELATRFNQVNSRSTGDCIVGSAKELFILLNSSGNIIYHADPDSIYFWEHFGSGKLIKG